MLAARDPVLMIDGDAVARNLELVRARLLSGRLIAVVKDDAYGHGMIPIARVLESRGVDAFAVASVDEACALRESGIRGTILNLRLFRAAEAPRIVRGGLVQAVFTEEQADLLAGAAREEGRAARVHLKVDTGLGQFGVPVANAAALLGKLRASRDLVVEGVFSTLAEDAELDARQIAVFDALRGSAGLREGEDWHLLASRGLLEHPEVRLDAARIGCLLCGFPPGESPVEGLAPTVRLEAEVIGVRRMRKGDRAGFGGRWKIERDLRAVWIGAGVRHGLRESMLRGGEVLVGGRRLPLRQIGGEYVVAESTDEAPPAVGDVSVLLGADDGESIDLATFAHGLGATPYTALQALRPSVRRSLIGAPRAG